jgi:hypothetical protein
MVSRHVAFRAKMALAMLTIGMAVKRPSCLGAKRGRGEFRYDFAALCFVLGVCGSPFGSPANAEEPERVAAKTEIDDGTAQETVLVSFSYSAPEGVEAEIAKEHNLKLVSKLGLPTLGMRIVRYAIPDSRPLATVLARLRAACQQCAGQRPIPRTRARGAGHGGRLAAKASTGRPEKDGGS